MRPPRAEGAVDEDVRQTRELHGETPAGGVLRGDVFARGEALSPNQRTL